MVIRTILRRWVRDLNIPEALVTDKIGHGKTYTLVAAAMISKLLTEKVVVGLALSDVWGITLEQWVKMVQNNYHGCICEESEWYPLNRLNLVPCHHLEMQTTPHLWCQLLTSALEPILVVTISRVAKKFKSGVDEMSYSTNVKLLDLLDM